jgi:hypothetical protein
VDTGTIFEFISGLSNSLTRTACCQCIAIGMAKPRRLTEA